MSKLPPLPKLSKPPPMARPGMMPRPAQPNRGGMAGPIPNLAQRVRQQKPKDGIEKAQVELTETQRAFREQRKNERARIEAVNDTEFWFCVFGFTRDQKEWMIRQLGLWEVGDKYIDAEAFWAAMRRLNPKLPPLPKEDFKLGTAKRNQRLADLAHPLPDPTKT